MLSLNRLLSCILAVTLFAPLRCTSFHFSINSTVPATTVEWIRNSPSDPPGSWKVVATLNGSNGSAFEPLNSTYKSGSFLLSDVVIQYQYPLENVTLWASIVQGDGSPGVSFFNQTFQIPAPTASISVPSPSTSGVSSYGKDMPWRGPPNSSTHMHGKDPPSTHIAIIGAVIGSVAILLIAVIVSFLWWRNRRRRLQKTYQAQFSGEKMVRKVGPTDYTSNILLKHQSMSSDSCYTESSFYSEDGGRPPTLEGLDAWVHEV